MKKHNPLSTAETLSGATSPRLKPWQAIQPRACFEGGLVGLLSQAFNVPQVDTFIEMPFCALSLSGSHTAIAIKRERSPRKKAPLRCRWRQARTFR
jgi:hypothetical protein